VVWVDAYELMYLHILSLQFQINFGCFDCSHLFDSFQSRYTSQLMRESTVSILTHCWRIKTQVSKINKIKFSHHENEPFVKLSNLLWIRERSNRFSNNFFFDSIQRTTMWFQSFLNQENKTKQNKTISHIIKSLSYVHLIQYEKFQYLSYIVVIYFEIGKCFIEVDDCVIVDTIWQQYNPKHCWLCVVHCFQCFFECLQYFCVLYWNTITRRNWKRR
jgi:hypothetical protein